MSIVPFLMFTGKAEEALNFYTSHIRDSKILEIQRYGAGADSKMQGKVELARIYIQGLEIKVIDSPPVHEFDFTASTSFFVECDEPEEVDRLVGIFEKGGKVLMPLDSYPFSERYCWVTDKFGVSWQFSIRIRKSHG